MKKSKRCPICNFSPDLLEELHLQFAYFMSTLKVWSWWTATHPESTVSRHSFDNHFGRGEHFTKEDAEKLLADREISSEIVVTNPVTIIPLILTKNIPEINPLAHITSIHIKTLQKLKELDNSEKEQHVLFLKYLAEIRKQIELISLLSKKFAPKITNDQLRSELNKAVVISPEKENKILEKMSEELGV